MSEGKLYQKVDANSYIPRTDEGWADNDSVLELSMAHKILNEAKAEFPIKYAYNAWEIPETHKQVEKELCKVLAWYQKHFGKPTDSLAVTGESKQLGAK